MNTLTRNDRHVHRGILRVNAGAPVSTLVFNIEEALRLCSLPGENEGRTYYFRNLSVRVPPGVTRYAWVDAFQFRLFELAGQAVHGSLEGSEHADAVFFQNEWEACGSVLGCILEERRDRWFWLAVSGSPAGASPSVQVQQIIRKLSRSEASWMAVAAAVFALPKPMPLLSLLPEHVAEEWLHEVGWGDAQGGIDSPGNRSFDAPEDRIALPAHAREAVIEATSLPGPNRARVLWIAALAAILARPSDLETRRAVTRARMLLRNLQRPAVQERQEGRAKEAYTLVRELALETPAQIAAEAARATAPAPAHLGQRRLAPAPQAVFAETCLGEATLGAGLYFLLNALKYLGFPDSGLDQPFLAHLFRRVARHAGIKHDDVILMWASAALEGNPSPPDERLLRRWLRKVRRWCWRQGAIGMSEIVRRKGFVTLTRTDLDVSLSLDSVDIRIRRIGLDLDPGWVPWFGRVVHFHYRNRGELS